MSEYQPRHAKPEEAETQPEQLLTIEEVLAELKPVLNKLSINQHTAFVAFLENEIRPGDTPYLLYDDFRDRYQGSFKTVEDWLESHIQEQGWTKDLEQAAADLGIPPQAVEIDRSVLISYYFYSLHPLLDSYVTPGQVHIFLT